MVATKLEQKVAELEKALAVQAETEKALIQAKEEWERSFEAIGDIAMILSPELRVTRANRQAYVALAGESGQELVGRLCHEVFHEEGPPCAGCPVLLARHDFVGHACEIMHKNLGRIFQVSVSPILDGEGRVLSFIHFAKDITAQKEMEQRLNQAEKLEAIGTLAGGIAHDFNNILTPILGYAEMMKMELARESPAWQHLDQVVNAALRAKELVQHILTFSRQQEHQRLPMAPHHIIKEALKLLRASIPTTIEIRQNINAESGTVLADASQIHRIIMNLCTNAFHAMRKTGGVLAVSLQPVHIERDDPKVNGLVLTAGHYVVLEVSDTGCGMDKMTLAKIFDPYFTTKEKGEGTGLGLSVVHGIVKESGGYISVYSEPGKGSTFRVYLPRIVSPSITEAALSRRPMPRGTERILLVDDDQAIVDLETMMLKFLGYRITAMTGSKEALQLFQQTPRDFNLVLTDMTMPGLTGAELSLRIHAIRPEIPIIICSGFSELIDGDKARELGIQAFLMKPVLHKDLAEAIRKALDGVQNSEKKS
ncbi:MAG: hypothetical protein BWK76_00100 [Desulfobulbaceae bacterium A2]|nr:MAG: hypothetical protein BWK76_00100 [Desulfobulbaceae bacterium A2]